MDNAANGQYMLEVASGLVQDGILVWYIGQMAGRSDFAGMIGYGIVRKISRRSNWKRSNLFSSWIHSYISIKRWCLLITEVP